MAEKGVITMQFIKINKHLINLEEVVYVHCSFGDLIIGLKDKEEYRIYFDSIEERDAAFDKIHYAISRFGSVVI